MKRLLVALALALVLLSAAPTSAAAPERRAEVVAQQDCDEQIAPFRVTYEIEVHGRPVGRATTWSCVSIDDMLRSVEAQTQYVKQDACKRYGSCE